MDGRPSTQVHQHREETFQTSWIFSGLLAELLSHAELSLLPLFRLQPKLDAHQIALVDCMDVPIFYLGD